MRRENPRAFTYHPSDDYGLSFRKRVRRFERQLVFDALAANENSQARAAKALRISRSSLFRILKREGVERQVVYNESNGASAPDPVSPEDPPDAWRLR